MTYSKPVRTTHRRITRIPVAILLVVIAAIAPALIYPLLAASSPTAASASESSGVLAATAGAPHDTTTVFNNEIPGAANRDPALSYPLLAAPSPTFSPPIDVLSSEGNENRGAPGSADGVVPEGTTVYDDEIPGLANLDPALLDALRQAATDAADDGVGLNINSGWRSPEYQEQLFHEAVSKYGSEEEAARWVATPGTSAHVSGDAIDIGPLDAARWLYDHGPVYGLCRIYGNEPWHYELRPEAVDSGCPPMYADPTYDPRMQQ